MIDPLVLHPGNTGLGILQDSPRILAAALKYLTEQGHYGESTQ